MKDILKNSKDDNLKLLDEAKNAYYSGEPIISDVEYDALEKALNIENNSYVGTHHREEYTIKHPFVMGSLSKIQVKESEDKSIDFNLYAEETNHYLSKSRDYGEPEWFYQVTPKYDGCSFEVVIDYKTCSLESVSTRGDCYYGKDIKSWFIEEWEKNEWEKTLNSFKEQYQDNNYDKLIVRGECLLKQSIFNEKYEHEFTHPRSFVAGMLGQDWESSDEQLEHRKDLSWVCYDYRFANKDTFTEIDYVIGCGKFLPGEKATRVSYYVLDPKATFKPAYQLYDSIRKNNELDFAMDGFVIKPGVKFRLQDNSRERQEDCVAIKFIPEIVNAEVKDVEWNVGKSGEYYPVANLKTVNICEKDVSRVSLHNYGFVLKNQIGPGTILQISLAGDIIPFVYDVVQSIGFNEKDIPSGRVENNRFNEPTHLYKIFTGEEVDKNSFLMSVRMLKIQSIGPKVADKLWMTLRDSGKIENNILNIMTRSSLESLGMLLGPSKSATNIINALTKRRKELSVKDIIIACCFSNCGEKNAENVAMIMSGSNIDTTGMNKDVLVWATDKNSKERLLVEKYIKELEILEVQNVAPLEDDITYVILTGDPKAQGYKSKSEFLSKHPEFKETTKWNQCKIVFTGDIESKSSKMEKAKKLGIEIKLYV